MVEINFHGSVSKDRAAVAYVLRNSDSQVIGAGAFNLDGATISITEAVGLRERLRFAKHKGFENVAVKGDSKLIIEVVQGRWEVPWRVKTLIDDVHLLACTSSRVVCAHIYREANFVADVLAHFKLTFVHPHVWYYCLPSVALNAFNFDYTGNDCTRGFDH